MRNLQNLLIFLTSTVSGHFNNKFIYTFIVDNLLNTEYTPHISRIRGIYQWKKAGFS